MNIAVLTKVRVQSINDVNIPDRYLNKLRGDTIRLGSVFVFNGKHNKILETIFSTEELNCGELFWGC